MLYPMLKELLRIGHQADQIILRVYLLC